MEKIHHHQYHHLVINASLSSSLGLLPSSMILRIGSLDRRTRSKKKMKLKIRNQKSKLENEEYEHQRLLHSINLKSSVFRDKHAWPLTIILGYQHRLHLFHTTFFSFTRNTFSFPHYKYLKYIIQKTCIHIYILSTQTPKFSILAKLFLTPWHTLVILYHMRISHRNMHIIFDIYTHRQEVCHLLNCIYNPHVNFTPHSIIWIIARATSKAFF